MKLIFIHYVGIDFNDKNVYQFLFSSKTENVSGEDWDSYPALGNPKPPVKHVEESHKLVADLSFDLIQDHETFDMCDAVEGVISLAWEDRKDFRNSDRNRLYFRFGEDKENVINKLYERDIELTI